jgi:hypothetical protein
VVVEVSPPGALDAYRLRGAIGVELGVDAVGPDDPRAATARGSLRIVVDAESHHLTVSYKKKTEPETRTVDLPADAEAAQKAAVVLAGNLGRDEASELAAQLRKQPTTTPEPQEAAASTTASGDQRTDAPDRSDWDRNARDLQAALDYYAAQDHRERMALGWAAVGAGTVVAATTLAAPWILGPSSSGPSQTDLFTYVGVLAIPAAAFAVTAAIPLLNPTQLERLAAYERKGAGAEDTARTWGAWAESEHANRGAAGVVGLVFGAIYFGLGAVLALDSKLAIDSNSRAIYSGGSFLLGAVFVLAGTENLAREGPLESALHAYERGHGIPLWKLAEHVAVAPTSGGAVGSFAFRF